MSSPENDDTNTMSKTTNLSSSKQKNNTSPDAIRLPPSIVPWGAVAVAPTTTQFKVWAPATRQVNVQLIALDKGAESVVRTHSLCRDDQGFYFGEIDDCPAGTLYRFELDNQHCRPDPRSRFQPTGVHGPSQVIDSQSFCWNDQQWTGVKKRDLVIYELHVGSFTQPGTYAAAMEQLDDLKQLGITAIEVLPLAQTPGRWNWGYDGVNYYAPNHRFGTPNELKAFVDACHKRGIAVIIDVVYNHVGPEGNYLPEFGPYRSPHHQTPWGDAFNFDGDGSENVRQFVIDNILFWIDEYHFDGLRLDAVHYMFDDSKKHILDEIQARFRHHAQSTDRTIYLIGESNIYDANLVGNVSEGTPHYDAIWSDCLMHSIYTVGDPKLRLTDRNYEPTDLSTALQHGYVFSTPQAIRTTDDQRTEHHPQGDRCYLESLITALQTHDSVGNHPHGKRLHQLTTIEFQRAAVPLILLYPSIPMIFMGEEWASESPFPFFADFEDPGLRQAVDRGRKNEYPHHDWAGSPLPSDPNAFHSSKFNDNRQNLEIRRWYRNLLALRKTGITDGWLNANNLSVHSELETSTYQLTYNRPDGKIHICTRLASPTDVSIPIETLNAGEVILDSRTVSGRISEHLHSQHCLIWFTPIC